jgi:hypothetical protein
MYLELLLIKVSVVYCIFEFYSNKENFLSWSRWRRTTFRRSMAPSLISLRTLFKICDDHLYPFSNNLSKHHPILYKVDARPFWFRGPERTRLFKDNHAQNLWKIHGFKTSYKNLGDEFVIKSYIWIRKP